MQLDENQLRNIIAQIATKVDTCELTVKEAITAAVHKILSEWQEDMESAAECCLCDGHNGCWELGHLAKAIEVKAKVKA
jgi:hypothetical protein